MQGRKDAGDELVRAPDGYEEKYMAGQGRVLHREKSVAPWYFHLLFMLVIAVGGAGGLLPMMSGEPNAWIAALITLPVALLLAVMWLLFVVLRVTVTEGEVHIQYGLFGPRIPMWKIKRAETVDYDWKEFGGWGIRRSMKDGAWIYNMWGDKGRAARITYEDESGADKTVMVGSTHATLLVDAVRRAHASRARPVKARVANEASESEAVEHEVEEQGGQRREGR